MICLATLFAATTLLAAADADFYGEAFRRGVAAFEAGSYDVALPRLRMAAFGYIDDLPRYEAAQAYLAVAARRLDRTAEAKAALQRLAAAERIDRHFASLQLSDAVRSAVVDAAKALLTPQQAALLTMPPAQPQIAANTPTAPPRTETIVVPDPLAVADHAARLKAAEDLYRAHDFRGAAAAFERAGAFAKGEEPYRYHYAVALYESGRHADAKRELAAALPFIEKTPEVERYRAKIERAAD